MTSNFDTLILQAILILCSARLVGPALPSLRSSFWSLRNNLNRANICPDLRGTRWQPASASVKHRYVKSRTYSRFLAFLNLFLYIKVKIWFQNRRMKWKRTKKGGKDASKEGRHATEDDDDEDEQGEESKLEIDDSDLEDNNNISVDDDIEDGILVRTTFNYTRLQSICLKFKGDLNFPFSVKPRIIFLFRLRLSILC